MANSDKRAIAYIDKAALIELLKVPYGMKIDAIDYPAKDDKVRIAISGDSLPVKKTSKNAKRLPVVKYTVLRHWHNAKIGPIDEGENK